MRFPRTPKALKILAALALVTSLGVAQTSVKPGWNLFTPEQDVQIGKEAAKEIEKEVEIVNDRRLTKYVADIGKRLADASPAPNYPYSFKIVAEPSINAFALPGGPIYMHSGLIAAADNEAQMAGVLAHEVAHVALRHSTNQATKAQAFQLPLLLAGGLLDKKGGILAGLAQLGIGFGVNSVFLKYSRDAEKQADILGAQMMAKVGYDPVEMARFFEKLESQGGSRMPQFFSDHPNPGNRVRYVQEEVQLLPPREYSKSFGDFERMKRRAQDIKPSKKKSPQQSPEAGKSEAGESQPSGAWRFTEYRGSGYGFSYPATWKVHQANDGVAVTIVPDDGVVRQRDGKPALAKGLMAGHFEPGRRGLREGTSQLISDLRASNPDLRPIRGQRKKLSVAGRNGESVLLEGPSALRNQRELVWLVTAERPGGLFYMVLVSPGDDYNDLRPRYQQIVQSLRFP